MKHTKKLVSLLLALVMVFALAVSVSAATVTMPTDKILEGHTYTTYQVFAGREENGILSDVRWGSGIDSTAFLAALKADTTYGSLFTACNDAAAVAKVLGENKDNTALANAVAELAYANKTGAGTALTSGTTELAGGYYLIVDTTENVAAGSAYNKALLQVVGDIDITVKTDAPTVDKTVTNNDSNNTTGNAADYSIGDAVPFTLIGSVPDMSRYDTYKYIFHDTLSAGFDAPATNAVKVYLSGDNTYDANDTDVTTSFAIEVSGQTITISCNNLKTISNIAKGQFIIVKYEAKLNSSAVIGSTGNPNTVYLEYSNKPDQSGSGNNNTGNTPEDKVIVFTYELDVTKVDGQNTDTKLAGAEFKLKNAAGKWVTVDDNAKVTGWADTEAGGSTLTTDANGLVKVIGLDAGTYYLKETKAPVGYNTLKDEIEIVITAELTQTEDAAALETLKISVDDGEAKDGNTSTGVVETTVKNNKGATLPETGGMGTTLFYAIGGILVLAAVVLFVTKRRMSAEK